MRTVLLAFLLVVHVTLVGVARGTTVDDICSPPGAPQGSKCACTATACEVRSMAQVSDGSVLDFAGRDLVLKQHGTFDVQGGSMQIKAANVTMEGGSALLGSPASGAGGSIDVEATVGDILVLKDAVLDAGGSPAGRIDLTAVRNARIAGAMRANGAADGSDGGTLTIDADSVDVSGTLEYSGSGEGFSGDASLLAIGGFSLAGTVNGSGQDGGSLDIDASTGEVSTTAQINLQATRNGGDAGTVDISAVGRVVLGGVFRLAGDGSGAGGGSGGSLDVIADGPIVISATLIDLSGAPPDGVGGDFSLSAGGDITLSPPGSNLEVQVQGKGSQGSGGSIDIDSEGAVQLPSLSAFGGDAGSGGTVFAGAWCNLTLASGRTIDTRGSEGDTTLAAGGQIIVAGRLFAGRANSLQVLAAAPDLTGATIVPPATQVPSPQLTPCGGPIIPGCGNGTLDPGEECDDGNTNACDGCSRSCQIERCGNGKIECGEVCDDGNNVDCDRCKGDCTRPDNICGDGITECGEEADDGNLVACDGVSPECRLERCGNDVRECNETCDDGTSGSLACSPQCQIMVPPRCGDGVVQTEDGETCDDGNAVDCDGCSHFCQTDGCGSGQIDANCGEECDDFNTRSGDGCSSTCKIEVCGNGRVDPGEQCDDGNQNECDGCHSDCTVATSPCPMCTAGGTQPCVPCSDASDCDPLRACGASACVQGACTPVAPPNCDDGNRCTTDICDPATGCVSTPVVCGDTTACDGTLSCDPASGQCVNGPAPNCDDGDGCTDDSCIEPGGTCRSQLKPGLEGATCRLSELQSLIDGATDVPKATRRKLGKQAKAIARKLPKMVGMGRKAARAQRGVTNGLNALRRTLAKARRKIPPVTLSKLNAAVDQASTAIGSL